MIARFLHWQATVSSDRSRIHIETTLRHAGKEPWSGEQGDALSYLLLDAATSNLITEGPRQPFPARMDPGNDLKLTISCDAPAAPGLYRVHVSPVREGVTWFHEAGSPFLSLEIEVTEAEVRVLEPIDTTGMTKRDAPALRDRTRNAIAEALDMMRAERAA